MAGMLELSVYDFKTTMTKGFLMDKVNNMKHRYSKQRYGDPKEKNARPEMMNASDRLTSRLKMAKKRIGKLEDILIKTSKIEKQK